MFRYRHLISCGIAALLIVYAALSSERFLRKMSGRARNLMLMGEEVSHPLYLCHMYGMLFLTRVLGLDNSLFVLFSTTLCLASAGSIFVNKFYDLPIRRFLLSKMAVNSSFSVELSSPGLVKSKISSGS